MPPLDIQNAIALLEQGKPGDAIPLLRRLTDAMPIYVTAFVLLARAYEAEHRWYEALAAWQRAQFLMPNSPSIREGVARVGGKAAAAPRAPEPDEETAPPRAEASSPPRKDEFVDLTAQPPAPPVSGEADEAVQTVPPVAQAPVEDDALAGDTAPAQEDAPARDEAAADEAGAAPPAREAAGDAPGSASRGPDEDVPAAGTMPEGGEEPGPGQPDDLDRLISELESARIVPRPDVDDLPAPDLDDDVEDMVSETLARIYASQRQYDEAARVYELLAAQQPGRAAEFLRKADQMRAQASDH